VGNEIIERLKKISIFKDFENDEERLSTLIKYLQREKYSSGEVIIREGELGEKLYILNKGSVRILKSTLADEKYTVTVLGADDNIFFGELALIDSDKRSATVSAETACEVFSVDRKGYVAICENDPLFGYKITMQIAKRIAYSLRKMNSDVITLFEALVNEVKGES
jgi:CRP/FNR family transcriptional regulator, cyclic AMP receptor protein